MVFMRNMYGEVCVVVDRVCLSLSCSASSTERFTRACSLALYTQHTFGTFKIKSKQVSKQLLQRRSQRVDAASLLVSKFHGDNDNDFNCTPVNQHHIDIQPMW